MEPVCWLVDGIMVSRKTWTRETKTWKIIWAENGVEGAGTKKSSPSSPNHPKFID